MYRLILMGSILFTLGFLACKEEPKPDQKAFNRKVEEAFNLDVQKLSEKIKVFYVQENFKPDAVYQVKSLFIEQVKPVKTYYVDSIKREIYLSSMKRISDNLQVRMKMIKNLQNRLDNYQDERKTEKIAEVQRGIESYTKRNRIQQADYDTLRLRDSLVRQRMVKQTIDSIYFYQVDFIIEEQIGQLTSRDTSSLIFNKDHEIEDLLHDRPWDGAL